MTSTVRRFGALMIALPLLGCAQSDLAPVEPGTVRITVTIQNEFMTGGELMALVSSLARVPVRDVMQMADTRYRMVLVCPDDPAACRAAVARIAADRAVVLGVGTEYPPRQQIPAQPPRDASR